MRLSNNNFQKHVLVGDEIFVSESGLVRIVVGNRFRNNNIFIFMTLSNCSQYTLHGPTGKFNLKLEDKVNDRDRQNDIWTSIQVLFILGSCLALESARVGGEHVYHRNPISISAESQMGSVGKVVR
jgi:hypothetical protein